MIDTGELIALLEVPDTPTTGEVRIARRRLAKRLHPDLAGERLSEAMAELNSGCDRLIRAIREGRHRRPEPVAPSPSHTHASAPRPTTDVRFRPEYAALTVAVMMLAFAVMALAFGATLTGFAAALLVAAIVGGGFVAALMLLLSRR